MNIEEMIKKSKESIIYPNNDFSFLLQKIKENEKQKRINKKRIIITGTISFLTLSCVVSASIFISYWFLNLKGTRLELGFDVQTDMSIDTKENQEWLTALKTFSNPDSNKTVDVFFGHKSDSMFSYFSAKSDFQQPVNLVLKREIYYHEEDVSKNTIHSEIINEITNTIDYFLSNSFSLNSQYYSDNINNYFLSQFSTNGIISYSFSISSIDDAELKLYRISDDKIAYPSNKIDSFYNVKIKYNIDGNGKIIFKK